MIAIARVKLRAAPIAAAEYLSAQRGAAVTFPGRGGFVVRLPPHGKVGGDFFARANIAPGRQRNFIRQPDVWVAGVVDKIVYTASMFRSMPEKNALCNHAITVFERHPGLDFFGGKHGA